MREQLSQAVLKILKSVDGLGLVTRDPQNIEDLARTNFPCVIVNATSEVREFIAGGGPDYIMSKITYELALWTQSPFVDTKRNNLFDSIETAFNAERKLGGLASDLVIREIRVEPQGSAPYSQSTLLLEVDYCFKRA